MDFVTTKIWTRLVPAIILVLVMSPGSQQLSRSHILASLILHLASENTLLQNMKPMSMPWHSGLCFGCHVNHRWSKGNHNKHFCPFQNHPGVKTNAENNIAALHKNHKSSGKRSKGGRGSSDKGGSKRSYMRDNPDFGRISKTKKSTFAANLVSNKGKLERFQKISLRKTPLLLHQPVLQMNLFCSQSTSS